MSPVAGIAIILCRDLARAGRPTFARFFAWYFNVFFCFIGIASVYLRLKSPPCPRLLSGPWYAYVHP
jgi:hypothetical protein